MPVRISRERKGDLLLECARLHYIEKLTKTQIAARLQISGTHVARLLREAEQAGIVEISVRLPADHDKLEAELRDRFGLHAVKIVDFSDDYEHLLKNLGRGGAAVFEELCQIRWGARVGLGGGITLYEVVEALETRPRQIELYPLTLVGRGPELEHVDSVFLVTALYFKSRPAAKAFVVGVPPLPQSRLKAQKFTADLLTEVDEVREVYQAARDVEVAFVGLNALPPDRGMLKEFSKVGLDLKTLKARGGVGVINYNNFDGLGQQIGEYFLSVSIQDLRGMSGNAEKKVVLVSGGLHKFEAIKVALTTRMFNMLVTDHRTAQKLAALPWLEMEVPKAQRVQRRRPARTGNGDGQEASNPDPDWITDDSDIGERKEGVGTLMFSKEEVESIVNQLRQEWGTDPNWEQLLRDVYLGMARADGGVALGNLDARVVKIIQQHQK